jgi:ribonucleoside-diphosphate reductase alpha chain
MKGGPVLSCPDAIAKAIERHLRGEQPKPMAPKQETTLDLFDENEGESKVAIGNVAGVCPDCGTPLAYEEGCLLCRSCGYSKCG